MNYNGYIIRANKAASAKDHFKRCFQLLHRLTIDGLQKDSAFRSWSIKGFWPD